MPLTLFYLLLTMPLHTLTPCLGEFIFRCRHDSDAAARASPPFRCWLFAYDMRMIIAFFYIADDAY